MKYITYILISILLGSCLNDVQKKHYYQLFYNNKKIELSQIDKVIRIKTIDVDKIYKRFNIVYRKSPHELFYSNTHLWAVKPDDMITDLLAKHFQKSGVFKEVLTKLEKRPDYEVTGRVIYLDYIDSVDRWFARVSITITLSDFKTGELLATHTFEEQRELFNPEPTYAVRAMSQIVEVGVNQFIKKCHEILSRS